MKRSPLGIGAKSKARASTFAAPPKPLATRKRLKARKPLRQVNPERKARKAELAWGPGGGGGVYATLLRARPCDTCSFGKALPSVAMRKTDAGVWVLDFERLERAAQCEFSHVIARGMGGANGRWWDGISQCRDCHASVETLGWGNCRGFALLLAHSLAWSSADQGIVPAPECTRPGLPAWADGVGEVQHYRGLLRAAWPERHKTEDEHV